jgi:hypothetical protein
MIRARCTFKRVGDAVLIEDLCDGRSVTNDAERVIDDMVERGTDVDRCVIVYRDTMGRWDQILTRNGKFFRFLALSKSPADEALAAGRRL